MAHLFPDCLEEVDVVTNAENIKKLLKLPYAASNCTISMVTSGQIWIEFLLNHDLSSFLHLSDGSPYWEYVVG